MRSHVWAFALTLVVTACGGRLDVEPSVRTTPSGSPYPTPPIASQTTSNITATAGRTALSISVPEGVLGPLALVADRDTAWITVGGTPRGELYRIDVGGRKLTSVASVGWAPDHLIDTGPTLVVENAIGDGSRPSSSAQNSVDIINKGTGHLATEVAVPNPGMIAADSRDAWVLSANETLERFSLAPNGPRVSLGVKEIGDIVAIGLGNELMVATRSADSDGSTLFELDRATGYTIGRVKIPESVNAIVPADLSGWLLVQDAAHNWFAANMAGTTVGPRIALPGNLDANTFVVRGATALVASNSGVLYRLDLAHDSMTRVDLTPAIDAGVIAIAPASDGAWLLSSTHVYLVIF